MASAQFVRKHRKKSYFLLDILYFIAIIKLNSRSTNLQQEILSETSNTAQP